MTTADTVLVALDCGGTSARAVLAPPTGSPEHVDGSSTLSGYLDPSEVPRVLAQIIAPIEEIYRRQGLQGTPVSVAIGAAGFTDGLRAVYRDAVDTVLRPAFGGDVVRAVVMNDSVALLLGHDADGVLIAGTGSNVLVRAESGDVVAGGGHDWAAGDQGSGFWIGLNGVRRVAHDVDAEADSALRRRFRAEYGDDELAQLRRLSVAGDRMKADIARFSAGVCAAAADGDNAARQIVSREAGELVDLLAQAVRRAGRTGALTLVGCGGTLRDDGYRSLVSEIVETRIGSVTWTFVDDGLAAALACADRSADDVRAWSELADRVRPLVWSPPTG